MLCESLRKWSILGTWKMQKMTRLPLYPPDPQVRSMARGKGKAKDGETRCWCGHLIKFSTVKFEARESRLVLLYLTMEAPHLFTWKWNNNSYLIGGCEYEIVVLKITECCSCFWWGGQHLIHVYRHFHQR